MLSIHMIDPNSCVYMSKVSPIEEVFDRGHFLRPMTFFRSF
jgi:hypothetical protein